MMAAAATKGLFLIFTLLSLICFTNSLMDKNQLDQLKEKLAKVQKQSDRVKENLTDLPKSSALLDDSIDLLDQMITYMKKSNIFDDDFPPVATFLEKVKGFVKETKAFVDRKNEELGGKMEENEHNLEKLKNLVKFLEENQAEL